MRVRRRLLQTSTALAGAASLALLSQPAALAATSPLPGGGSVTVDLNQPAAGSSVPFGTDVPLAGSARADGAPAPTQDTVLVYALDVSGSTSSFVSGGASACGDPDGLNGAGTVLDCEISSLVNLNTEAASAPAIAETAAVAFGGYVTNASGAAGEGRSDAASGDVSPVPGVQTLTGPATKVNSAAPFPDVVTVLRSASLNSPTGFRQFTPTSLPGGNTNYEAAVMEATETAGTSTRPHHLVVLVSDGEATKGVTGLPGSSFGFFPGTGGGFPNVTAFGNWVHTAAAGTRFVTFAVGNSASCAGSRPTTQPTLGTLQAIADATGGTCTRITNPADLPDVLPQVVQTTLQGISATVDGSPRGVTSTATFPVASGTDVPFSTTVSGLAPGTHSLCGRATGQDSGGSGTATDCRSVDVVAVNVPPTFGGGTSDLEGAAVPVSATLNGGAAFAGWSATPLTSDPGATCAFADPTALSTTVSCTDDGTFQLTASTVPADSRTSTLTLGNAAPQVSTPSFSASGPVFVGSSVQVSAPFADAGSNDSHTCSVDLGSATLTGTVTEPAAPGGQGTCSATTTVTQPGSFPATVHVTDDDGDSGSAATATGADLQVVDLAIQGGNQPGGGFSGVEGSAVHPTVSVPSGTTVSWTSAPQSSDPGTTCSLTGAATATPTVLCDDDASLLLTVTATLNGETRHATVPVTFANANPVLSVPSFDTTGPVLAGTPVTVSASFTDAGANDTHTCSALWSDGVSTPGTVSAGVCRSQRALPAALDAFSASLTVTDDNGGSDTRSTTEGSNGTITVTSVTVNPPAGGGSYSTTEGTPLAVSASGPSGVTWSWSVTPVTADPGAACSIANATTASPTVTCNDDGRFTITATATLSGRSQSASAPLQVINANPVIASASTSPSLVAVGGTVTLTAPFSDAGSNDIQTCSVDWGDGTPVQAGVVTAGVCKATRTAAVIGVSNPLVTVTDDDGGSGSMETDYLVVYDPSGGFVTGGGYVNVPAGSLSTNPAATGKANFGFNSKYEKGASKPSGNTEFQFQAGSLDFHSTAYDWLVVSGSKAQYRGTGTVNGQSGYSFLLTAVDAQAKGASTAPDTFRIKIWDASGGVLFDNQRGSSDDFNASMGQPLAGGSIVIHSAK